MGDATPLDGSHPERVTTPQQTSTGPVATDPVAHFFDELGRRGTEPLLHNVSGRIRFDVIDGTQTDSWAVDVRKGTLTVTRDAGPGDTLIRGERSVFEALVSGRMNVGAAVIRGALECSGDLQLMVAIQRIFPPPPRGWDPTADTRSR